MSTCHFEYQTPVRIDGNSERLASWYRAGLPAVVVAAVFKSASRNYRAAPIMGSESKESQDALTAFRGLTYKASSQRDVPVWTHAYIQEWALQVASGIPFNWEDVSKATIDKFHTQPATLAELFLWHGLETVRTPSREYLSTEVYNMGVALQAAGTFRAALWTELTQDDKTRVAQGLTGSAEHNRKVIAELEAIPRPRWQLDLETLPSYQLVQDIFNEIWRAWPEVHPAWRKAICSAVWAKGGISSRTADNYSRYNVLSTVSSAEDTAFEGKVRYLHECVDGAELRWLAVLSNMVPDPTELPMRWSEVKAAYLQELSSQGLQSAANRIRNLSDD